MDRAPFSEVAWGLMCAGIPDNPVAPHLRVDAHPDGRRRFGGHAEWVSHQKDELTSLPEIVLPLRPFRVNLSCVVHGKCGKHVHSGKKRSRALSETESARWEDH